MGLTRSKYSGCDCLGKRVCCFQHILGLWHTSIIWRICSLIFFDSWLSDREVLNWAESWEDHWLWRSRPIFTPQLTADRQPSGRLPSGHVCLYSHVSMGYGGWRMGVFSRAASGLCQLNAPSGTFFFCPSWKHYGVWLTRFFVRFYSCWWQKIFERNVLIPFGDISLINLSVSWWSYYCFLDILSIS